MAESDGEFIELWQAGVPMLEIGRQLGIPVGTVSSRASRLQKQGKIAKRPRGGARPHPPKAQRPAPPAVPSIRTSAEQSGAEQHRAVQTSEIPEAETRQWARLFAEIQAIKEAVQRSAAIPLQSSADTFADPDDAKAERWNLWIPRGLRRQIEALAAAQGVAPSKIVQTLLWQVLRDRSSATE